MNSLAPTFYPSMIAHACSALDESNIFKDMPDGFIRITLRLIKKINLKCPTAAIFASRGTIAVESGKSIETVQRAIKWLESRGLIEREQKANLGQRGSKSPIYPTQLLLTSLGLFDAPSRPQSEHRETNSDHLNSCAAAHPATSVEPQGQKKRFERVGNLTLPADLAWLSTSNGMPATGVLLLMKKAKEVQQRLSDVVNTTKPYLEKLHGRQLFAYIKTLLSNGKDFGQIARNSEESEKTEQMSEYLRNKADLLEGRSFSTKDGSLQIKVEAGVLAVQRQGQRFIAYMSQKFLDGIDAGRMRQHWD